MDEAEDLCDRIAIIDHGKILTEGTLEELTRLAGEGEVVRLTGAFDEAGGRDCLGNLAGVRVHAVEDGKAVLSVRRRRAGAGGDPAQALRRPARGGRRVDPATQPAERLHPAHRQGAPGLMVELRILRRDLTRWARNPITTALMFAVPLTMAAIFSLVFGGQGGDAITLRVLVHDEDDSLLSRLLQGGSSDSRWDERLELVPVGEEGYRMMEEGEANALLHIPPDFTKNFLAGVPVTLEVVKNPAQRFLPQLVEEGVGVGAAVLSQASVVFGPELATIGGFMDREGVPPDLQVGAFSVAVNQKLRDLETLRVATDHRLGNRDADDRKRRRLQHLGT